MPKVVPLPYLFVKECLMKHMEWSSLMSSKTRCLLKQLKLTLMQGGQLKNKFEVILNHMRKSFFQICIPTLLLLDVCRSCNGEIGPKTLCKIQARNKMECIIGWTVPAKLIAEAHFFLNEPNDLSKLNRDPKKIIYPSAHARENSLQPENGAVIRPYKSELDDTALVDFIPFLESDIRQVMHRIYEGHEIPAEFIRRTKEHQRKMQEQKQHGPRLWRH
ncbi:uncharacterized protein LOC133728373 isoform X2 [Rosa rugosa]|uniref:uncharacterized protein LOC133728373 isoform X2 n=1 Tax=Rosa rugosa TaxID=74645 RepID=UPI002B417E93|nr:uncharacterized protein LOC133728373 isoform X2 [Rosa rugosa]